MWLSKKQKSDAADVSLQFHVAPVLFSARRKPRLICCSCGATTPEIAVLTMVLIAAAIPSIGLLGQVAAHLISDVEVSLPGATGSSNMAAVPTTGASPMAAVPGYVSLWSEKARLPSLAVVAIAVVWLIRRNKFRKGSKNPRPLAKNLDDTACCRAVEQRQRIVKRLNNDTHALLRGDLEVRQLMADRPVTVRPNTTVQQACEIMEEQDLDYLLVCDTNGKFRGLVSRYYLTRSGAAKVVDAMLPNPFFVSSDAMLSPTITQMLDEGVSCVAVVEQDRAIGMLTTKDIQLTLQAILQVLAKAKCEKRFVECESTCP